MDAAKIKMAGYEDDNGGYVKGIEDFVPSSQYRTLEHQNKVVEDICKNVLTLSHGGKFHAIFATSSIPEAIQYYGLFKQRGSTLKVTCLFDPTLDNDGGHAIKEDALVEIITDYNERYDQKFGMKTFAGLKKDMALRLAHKEQYKLVERTPEMQIDLLIVVDQMLTGFDSKWVNTLYMDKKMQRESIIQAFSRTNRLFGQEKPFGIIRYYRKPHTMERYIEVAVKQYSGDKPIGLFVPKLEQNLNNLNNIYTEISQLFGVEKGGSFEKLPDDPSERGKFALLFKELNDCLEAATIQGFHFDQLENEFTHGQDELNTVLVVSLDETTYLSLALRYKELFSGNAGSGGGLGEDVPFDLVGHLTEIDTGRIDSDYMNSRFNKYLKLLHGENVANELIDSALNDLHKSFAGLSQGEQKYANIFLHDIQRGDATMEDGKTLRDYITEYQSRAKNDQMQYVSAALGIDESKLRSMMGSRITQGNMNEFGRFDDLKSTVDKTKAKAYFEKVENATLPLFKVNIKINSFLRKFILDGGLETDEW